MSWPKLFETDQQLDSEEIWVKFIHCQVVGPERSYCLAAARLQPLVFRGVKNISKNQLLSWRQAIASWRQSSPMEFSIFSSQIHHRLVFLPQWNRSRRLEIHPPLNREASSLPWKSPGWSSHTSDAFETKKWSPRKMKKNNSKQKSELNSLISRQSYSSQANLRVGDQRVVAQIRARSEPKCSEHEKIRDIPEVYDCIHQKMQKRIWGGYLLYIYIYYWEANIIYVYLCLYILKYFFLEIFIYLYIFKIYFNKFIYIYINIHTLLFYHMKRDIFFKLPEMAW